jgi:hypothetical protein
VIVHLALRLGRVASFATLSLCLSLPLLAASAPVRPYTAHFKITRTGADTNGPPLRIDSFETAARDSKGRTYRETKSTWRSGDQGGNRVSFFVEDPEAGTQTSWDAGSRKAVQYVTPPELHDKLMGCWANRQGQVMIQGPEAEDWHKAPPSPSAGKVESVVQMRLDPGTYKRTPMKLVAENLSGSTIAGMAVNGTRMTYIYLDKGAHEGEIESIIEMWRSEELALKLREKVSGPGFGEKTQELIDLKLEEPDPSLFSLPQEVEVERVELHQASCEVK